MYIKKKKISQFTSICICVFVSFLFNKRQTIYINIKNLHAIKVKKRKEFDMP